MNTFGNALKITIFGKSHGEYVGITLDGLPAGLDIREENISKYLQYRRPKPLINTARIEEDEMEIIGGFNGKTDGSPLTILIKNKNIKSNDYEEIAYKPRPGHADYPAFIKYGGNNDYRGGGQFSGRMTAPIVAAGGLLEPVLNGKGIRSLARTLSIAEFRDDRNYSLEELEKRYDNDLRIISDSLHKEIVDYIVKVRREGDSVGGVVETAIFGVPIGLGEPFFNSVESEISALAFSIPGIKGIEFGDGFRSALMKGSEFNDSLGINETGKIIIKTNHNGGINGGLTNGNPIVFRVAVRPTSSIMLPQDTVNLRDVREEKLVIKGRHDPCIVPRVVPIMESISYIVIMDLLLMSYGGGYFGKN